MAVCVAPGDVGSSVVTPGLAAAEDDPALEAEVARDDACGEPDVDAPARSVPDALGEVLPDDREAESVGDEVVDVPVCGVCVTLDGDEPPAVHAETATATRAAPAAERPTVSHAPRAPLGAVRRIFMTLLECVSDKFAFPSGPPQQDGGAATREITTLHINAFPASEHQPSRQATKQITTGPSGREVR
jgi:hypothetical protein